MGEVFLNKKPVVEEYEYAYVETADGSITKVPRNKIYPYVPASKEDVEKLSSEVAEEVGKLSNEIDDYKAYVISVFEQLKQLIQNGEMDAAVAVLDEAILDLSTLA